MQQSRLSTSYSASETENSNHTRNQSTIITNPKLEIEIRMSSQKHTDINPKHSTLGTFFLLATNAALSGEQRDHPT
ncbi:TPA: hypothetical protein ACGSU0_004721, partial [Vibrio parahaemolyticus]